MIRSLAGLIFLSTLSQTIDSLPQIPLAVAQLGDKFTMICPVFGDEAGLFYWYKMKFGHTVQTVAEGTRYKISLKGQFNNSRFEVTRVGTLYFLSIKNVSKGDEATYFCQAGAAYIMTFTNGTVLAVNDHETQQKSVYVKQSPETASVPPGDSVTLHCSLLSKIEENSVQCPGEHSVYWFRAGAGKSHPSIIYTHNHRSDEEEARSCDYSLSKTIQDSSDNGTYYCAVVTCGEILFGEGTKVETRQEPCLFVIVVGILLSCIGVVIVIVIVVVVIIITRNQKPVCEVCKGEVAASNQAEHDRLAEDEQSNMHCEATVNYAALDFSSRKRERWTTNKEVPQDCLYSSMRDCQ